MASDPSSRFKHRDSGGCEPALRPSDNKSNTKGRDFWERVNFYRNIIYVVIIFTLNCGFLILNAFYLISAHKRHEYGSCDLGGNTQGNPDLYGIGIRSAIYLQLFFTLVLQLLFSQHILSIIPTHLWFLLAMFCAVISNGQANAFDSFLVALLGSGVVTVSIIPMIDPRLGHTDDQFSTLCRYGIWGIWKISISFVLWRLYPVVLRSRFEHIDPVKLCTNTYTPYLMFLRIQDCVEWVLMIQESIPHILTAIRIWYLFAFRLEVCDIEHNGGGINGLRPPSGPLNHQKPRTKNGVWLDCLCVFPVGDLQSFIYDRWKQSLLIQPSPDAIKEMPKNGTSRYSALAQTFGDDYARLCSYLRLTYQQVDGQGMMPHKFVTPPWETDLQLATAPLNAWAHPRKRRPWIFWALWVTNLTSVIDRIVMVEYSVLVGPPESLQQWTAGQIVALVVSIGACCTIIVHIKLAPRRTLYIQQGVGRQRPTKL